MQRRSFLSALVAAATLDPEKLLWIPGQRTIFVPPPFQTVTIYRHMLGFMLGFTEARIKASVLPDGTVIEARAAERDFNDLISEESTFLPDILLPASLNDKVRHAIETIRKNPHMGYSELYGPLSFRFQQGLIVPAISPEATHAR